MDEILTVKELAATLKISKSQVYELTNERPRTGDLRENPIPVLRLGTTVRFRRSDVDSWLAGLADRKAA